MYYSESLNFMVSIITPIILIYILMFVIILGQRYLRIYSRNKTLKFTQEEIKEKKREISNLRKNVTQQETSQEKGKFLWEFGVDEQLQYLYEVFNLYNELAVGINEGLYDELYVKMVMGNEMMIFYKRYNNNLITSMENDTIFMPLELLLKKWDNNEGPSYKAKNGRR